VVQIPDFLEDAAGELTDGSDPSPTPPLSRRGAFQLPLPLRGLRGWGVRFSEFARGILREVGDIAFQLIFVKLLRY